MVEFDAFAGDIAYGGLRNMLEIKILVCYMLSHIKDPITRKLLGDCLTAEGLVNFFDLNQALDELIRQKIVLEEEHGADKNLKITDEGRKVSSALETNLIPTTRERAVNAALKLSSRARAERETTAEIEKTESGYRVTFVIYGVGEELLHLTLFAPDILQAEQLREGFLRNPAAFYSAVVDHLAKREN